MESVWNASVLRPMPRVRFVDSPAVLISAPTRALGLKTAQRLSCSCINKYIHVYVYSESQSGYYQHTWIRSPRAPSIQTAKSPFWSPRERQGIENRLVYHLKGSKYTNTTQIPQTATLRLWYRSHKGCGQYFWLPKRTWILCEEFNRAHNTNLI